MSKQVESDQLLLAGFLLVLAFAGIIYYYLDAHGLERTSALFIGIAAVLAIGLSLLPKSESKTVTGTLVKGMSLALILSMIIFNEGLVCIFMATPLFLAIAISVGQSIDKSNNKARMRVWLVLILLPLSLEGITEELSFDRSETVTVSRVVPLSPEQVEQKLAHMPDLSQTLPVFLQLGFPAAQNYSGEGLNRGSERCFHVPPRENLSGDVCWQIEQRGPNNVLFKMMKDESKIAHWMTWRTAKVEWSAEGQRDAGPNHVPRESLSESTVSQLPPLQRGTRVTVTLKFWRKLDPAWYFSPLERYAVGLTGDYLIGSYFGGE